EILSIFNAGSAGKCFPPTLAKIFTPSDVRREHKSHLVITLSNANSTDANLTSALIDSLPNTLRTVGHHNSNTCGGLLLSSPDHPQIIMVGGSIPGNGSCILEVSIKGSEVGTFINTLPVGALQTDLGSNIDAASATLTVH